MATHFIIDIETMGAKSAASAITSIACVPIDFDNLQDFDYYMKNGFLAKINWVDQIKNKTHVTESGTVDWWKRQPLDAQNKSIVPHSTDLLLHDALERLNKYVRSFVDYDFKSSWFWSRGIAFDFPKLEYSFGICKVSSPINTFMLRDIRTMVDCFTGSTNGRYLLQTPPANFVKHCALSDAAYDAAAMVEIYKENL